MSYHCCKVHKCMYLREAETGVHIHLGHMLSHVSTSQWGPKPLMLLASHICSSLIWLSASTGVAEGLGRALVGLDGQLASVNQAGASWRSIVLGPYVLCMTSSCKWQVSEWIVLAACRPSIHGTCYMFVVRR